MERLKRRWTVWRRGAVTGVSLQENSLRQSAYLFAPLIVAWFVVKAFFPDAMYNMLMTLSGFLWIGYGAMLWSYAKANLQNYLVFPSSKWRFPDGTVLTFDLKIPPDAPELIVEFPDGRKGYKIHDLGDNFMYDDPDLPFPRFFRKAYWTLPSFWDESFARRSVGEVFHLGIAVTKKDCEDITVNVYGFDSMDGDEFPLCEISDCTWNYRKSLERARTQIVSSQGTLGGLYQLLYRGARLKADKLASHTAYLEDRLEVAEKQASEDFHKSAEKIVESGRKRHEDIVDIPQPWRTKYLNLKTLAIAGIVIAVVFFVGKALRMW